MENRMQYNYAIIDPVDGFCFNVKTRNAPILGTHTEVIEIPYYNPDYLSKFYNISGDKKWYLDPEFTQPWVDDEAQE